MIIDDQDDVLSACLFPNDIREYVPGAHFSRMQEEARRDAQVEQNENVLAKAGDDLDSELFAERPYDRAVRLARKIFGEHADEAITAIRKMRDDARTNPGQRAYSH